MGKTVVLEENTEDFLEFLVEKTLSKIEEQKPKMESLTDLNM